MRRFAFALLACALLAPPLGAGQSPAIRTNFRPAKPHFTLHEPVFLEFTMENAEAQEIKVDLGKNRKGSFSFDVVAPDGTRHDNLRLPLGGVGSTGVVALAAGETYRQRVLLNEWFGFAEPGDYRVRARLGAGAAGSFVLTIHERDGEALQRVCRGLLETVFRSPVVLEQIEAIRALSYVEDPVAVPYMARVFEANNRYQYMLVGTLERIATPAAVEVLIWSLSRGDEDARPLARGSLSRMAGKTTDQAIRDRIQSVLRDLPQ
jgi:hypothetical protein